jgi:uncharacterized LabA/DUF88 family protein
VRSHCAVYVDAGYLLSSAATRLTGTSLRSGVDIDHQRLIEELTRHAEEASGLPLLRVHWYDAARNGVPDASQEMIGLLPRVKLRLGRIGFTGEQKGVDLRIGLDIVAHARNGAVDVIYLVSGDDDLTEAVDEAQVHGVQVMVLAIPDEAGAPHGVSRHLQRAADGLELLDPGDLDAAVQRTATAVTKPAVSADTPPSSVVVPRSPAHLANRRRSPASAVVSPSELPRDGSGLVYTAATGEAPTVAAEFSRTSDELMRIVDGVVGRVLESWLRSASVEQQQDVVAGRPSIPRDVDRALLLDLSAALGDYDLSDAVRIQLRARFWLKFDEMQA